jgi:hypothetical protein
MLKKVEEGRSRLKVAEGWRRGKKMEKVEEG